MGNNTLTVSEKRTPLLHLPKSQLIDIGHFAGGLFLKGLLRYEDITAVAKMLNKVMRNKVFEHEGVQYRVMSVLSVGKDVKMRITRMEMEDKAA